MLRRGTIEVDKGGEEEDEQQRSEEGHVTSCHGRSSLCPLSSSEQHVLPLGGMHPHTHSPVPLEMRAKEKGELRCTTPQRVGYRLE